MDTLETNGVGGGANPIFDQNEQLGLVIVFAADAPDLHGALLPLSGKGQTMVLGRSVQPTATTPADGGQPTDKYPRLVPVRQRPGQSESIHPIVDPFLSSQQLHITLTGDNEITIANVGKRDLLDASGRTQTTLTLAAGEIAEVRGRLLLFACKRLPELPRARSLGKKFHPFGEPDVDGLVGESASAWKLRDVVAFASARSAHVLLLGESGTGKEIVASAIHRLSTRHRQGKTRNVVSRNAATLPPGLIDAELFGHVANYPNAGMPERPGLIAEADGSTLFLDEIGELSHELSTKLLRVLDEKGEYQRLGDSSRTRTSSFRLIAATNRAVSTLKEDLAARFRLRILMPSLTERREDIPLLARHLLRRAAVDDPAIGERFFEGWNDQTRAGEPRISIDLMKQLVLHPYRTHIRELDTLLWASLGSSPADTAELTPEVMSSLSQSSSSQSSDADGDNEHEMQPRVDAHSLTEEDVRGALERANGVHEKAWRELGLGNRHVLRRLIKKFGLTA